MAGAYTTANQLPNTLYEVVVGGVLAATVVPLLAAPIAAGRREEVTATASGLLGLVLAVLAGLITARAGRAVPGSIPVVAMAVIAVFFGLARYPLPLSLVLVWWALVVAWWASAAQYQRITLGQDVLVGRASWASFSLDRLRGEASAWCHRRSRGLRRRGDAGCGGPGVLPRAPCWARPDSAAH